MTRRDWVALGAVLLIAAALRMSFPDVAYFNIHVARDCHRTLEFLHGENFRTHGPELRFGGQTPGWLLYPLMAPPLLVTPNPIGLSLWIGLLAMIGVALTHLIGRAHGSPRLGLIAALLLAVQVPLVLSLRYLWNPTFLMLISPLMLWLTMRLTIDRKSGALPWLALAWCVGASVHFSTHLLLLPIIVMIALARPRIRAVHWIAALLIAGITFGPYALRELRDRGEDLTQIITSDQTKVQVDDVRPFGERWRFNPNMLIVAAHHLRIPVPAGPYAFREDHESIDFTHTVRLYDVLDEVAMAPAVVRGEAWLSQIWVILFLIALVALAVALSRRWGGGAWRGETPEARATATKSLWLLWLLLPSLVLVFFNFYRPPPTPGLDPERAAVFSFRYFYIVAPAPFLIIAWLFERLMRAQAWRVALWSLLLLHTAGSLWWMAEFFHASRATGVVFVHHGVPERQIYTLGHKLQLVDLLVDDLGLTAQDLDRLSGHWMFSTTWWTEDEIDYLLKTHPRIQEGTPRPDAPRIRLWADQLRMPNPAAESDFELRTGLDADSVEVVGEDQLGGIHITQYRWVSPEAEAPVFNMRNMWEPMPFR